MIYKDFGKTGVKLSALGFGAMRLPMAETNGQQLVDDEKALPILRRAFEQGVNYVDTAPYYLEKQSEVVVGKALKGWRDKVYLSTKNPIECGTEKGYLERLEASLKRLDTDYIDFYHMWGINQTSFRERIMKKGGAMDGALKAKSQGLIKHISFSFHDKTENMKEMIDSGYFESVLMQYNLLDRANEGNINYAHEKGLGVVIMGPVGGGRLGAPAPAIAEQMKGKIKSSAAMALRFVLANPGVNVALSGMSTMEQLEENLLVAAKGEPMSASEEAAVAEMLEETRKYAQLYCTGCNYCMPCPQAINIPRVFEIMNMHRVYDLTGTAKWQYREYGENPKNKQANACVECGACEKKCPQKIQIIKQLKETHTALA